MVEIVKDGIDELSQHSAQCAYVQGHGMCDCGTWDEPFEETVPVMLFPKREKSMRLDMFGTPTIICGGPFREWDGKGVGICMAAELGGLPATMNVGVADFKTPTGPGQMWALKEALSVAIDHMLRQRPVYVGCMGGVGRTGLFLSLLAKIVGTVDPVSYVREHYNPHAVETTEQREFVQAYDVRRLRRYARLQEIVRRFYSA